MATRRKTKVTFRWLANDGVMRDVTGWNPEIVDSDPVNGNGPRPVLRIEAWQNRNGSMLAGYPLDKISDVRFTVTD
jgi:hypothetical protein